MRLRLCRSTKNLDKKFYLNSLSVEENDHQAISPFGHLLKASDVGGVRPGWASVMIKQFGQKNQSPIVKVMESCLLVIPSGESFSPFLFRLLISGSCLIFRRSSRRMLTDWGSSSFRATNWSQLELLLFIRSNSRSLATTIPTKRLRHRTLFWRRRHPTPFVQRPKQAGYCSRSFSANESTIEFE